MKDAFGVERSVVSKIVVRTPTRLVRLMSDKLPRPAERIDEIGRQMKGPDGFVNPVNVAFSRRHNMTAEAAQRAQGMGLKVKTRLPTPKLMNGNHRLALAEQQGQKSMLVDWTLRNKREGNIVLKSPKTGEWVDGVPYGGIPKDRTKEVAAGAAAFGVTGVGGAGYMGYRHHKNKVKKRYVYHGTTARAAKNIMRHGFKNNASWGETDARGAAVYVTDFDAARNYARAGAPNKLGFYRRGRVVRAEMQGEAKPAYDDSHGSSRWLLRTDASNLTPKRVIKIPLGADERKHNALVGGAYGAGATAVGGTGYLAMRKKRR